MFKRILTFIFSLSVLSGFGGLCVADDSSIPPSILRVLTGVDAGASVPHLHGALTSFEESGIRPVFLDRCQEDGDLDLFRLAETSDYEAAFLFIPPLCVWLEIGVASTRNSVRLDMALVRRALVEFNELVFYHTHVGERARPVEYTPAYRDFLTMVLISADFAGVPRKHLMHRAVSKLGIFEYRFTNIDNLIKLRRQIIDSGIPDHVSQNVAWKYSGRKFVDQYYSKILSCNAKANLDSRRLDHCFPIVTEVFTLTYKSRRNGIN